MKSPEVKLSAFALADDGLSQAAISRELVVSRTAVRRWLSEDRRSATAALIVRRLREGACASGHCLLRRDLPRATYAYLLGLYLGDGWLATHRRGVYRLRITCCDDYPKIMDECEAAIAAVMPACKVSRVRRPGCTDVGSYSKHWKCLFPQHGLGPKHERSIVLADWQQQIVAHFPREFLRGLVQSDGCRVMNRVVVRGKRYAYRRYFFTNASYDIRMLFGDACDRIGVEWRHSNKRTISVARRASVATLDEFIGPKS